jgi:nucleoside-diphosphate-sugar epimerase
MSFVVVGKNSFIARHLKDEVESSDWVFLSHKEALETEEWCENADVVINCAFSPKLYTESYDPEEDIDLKLANKIKGRVNIHYVMISSRSVYGDAENLKETEATCPTNHYGRTKIYIEKSIAKTLGAERLSILRCSNIVGENSGEHTFLGKMLSSLRRSGRITLHMSTETKKDFVPVLHVCSVLRQVAERKLSGVYNVGLGRSTKCGDMAEWLIQGYGQGSLEVFDNAIKGQFFMDISKLKEKLNMNDVDPTIIKQLCIDAGRRLNKP